MPERDLRPKIYTEEAANGERSCTCSIYADVPKTGRSPSCWPYTSLNVHRKQKTRDMTDTKNVTGMYRPASPWSVQVLSNPVISRVPVPHRVLRRVSVYQVQDNMPVVCRSAILQQHCRYNTASKEAGATPPLVARSSSFGHCLRLERGLDEVYARNLA